MESDFEDVCFLRLRYQYSIDSGVNWNDIYEVGCQSGDLISYLWDTTDPVDGAPDGDILVRAIVDDDMMETVSEVQITIDNTPPTTSSDLSGTLGNNGWYISSVWVDLPAVDGTSGVDVTYYRINGGSWQEYSGSFLITSEGIYTLEYYSIDIAGNIEGINLIEIKVDKNIPDVPTVWSSTHQEDVWSNNINPIFIWVPPSDISGIVGYSYLIDDNDNTLPDEISEGTDTQVQYFNLQEGIWYFHIIALDGAGHWSYPQNQDEWYFKIKIDTISPGVPIISSPTHGEDIWEFDNDPVFTWTEPYDLNGISGYSYILDQTPTTIPDLTSEGSDRTTSYNDVTDGTWYFHVRALDPAGNGGETDHYKIKIDTISPTSSVNVLPTYITSLFFDIPFTAEDVGCGLQYVELWYRIDTGNGFSKWTKYSGTYTSSPIPFTAPYDGIYEFFTIATDNANHIEDGPIWVGHENDKNNEMKSIAWGDLNGDGYLDLAIGGHCNHVHVYLNDNGMLENIPIWSGILFDIQAVKWCDFDNDGDQDLSIAGISGSVYFVEGYLNTNGMLSSTSSWYISDSNKIYSISWGDFDGDGDLDLATGTAASNKIYRNIGGILESTPNWVSDDLVLTRCVAWGDVDNDGDLDLAAGNHGNNVIYLNIGGTLSTSPFWQSDPSIWTSSITWGDVNNDGYLDLAVGNIQGNYNELYFNTGGSLETSPSWVASDPGYTRCITFGDINGDGKLDLIVGDDHTYVYFNIGTTLESVPFWNTVDPLLITGVGLGNMDNNGLQIIIDEAYSGDGSKKVFYLQHYPIHSIQDITVNGIPLSPSDYCLDFISGWISFKNTPPPGSNNILVDYKYSTNLEIASAGWNPTLDISYVTVYEYTPRTADTSTIVDTTPPESPIISSPTHPSQSTWYSDNDPSFEWTEPYDVNGIAGYSFILDDISNTIPDTISEGLITEKSYVDVADGIWYFHVRAMDYTGNWGVTCHYTIKVDITPPSEPTVDCPTHPEDVWTSNDYVDFTFSGPTSDLSGIADYSYEFDQTLDTIPDTIGEGTMAETYLNVDDGIWYFHARAVDNAGNWGATRHYKVKIDTTPAPAPTITSPTHPDENAWYDNNDPEFTWNVPSDMSGIDGYSIILDQNPNYPLDSTVDLYVTTYSYTDVADSIWYFQVIAIDNAGNIGIKGSYKVKIDTTLPPAPIISSTTHEEDVWTNNNDPIFEWTVPYDPNGIAGYSYILDTTPNTIPDTTSEGSATTKSYSNVADGIWYFHVRAVDNAGKWGDADHYKIKIDVIPPEITAEPDVAIITDSSATIEWTTSELSDSFVWWEAESGPEEGWVEDSNYVIDHSITITGLSLDQEYIYIVQSKDAAGNTVTSDAYSFTMKKINTFWYPDTSNPNYELSANTFVFPSGGGYEVFYVKIPKTGKVLSADFTLVPDYIYPELPLNPAIDIGNDGTNEYAIAGELDIEVTIHSDKYTFPNIIQAIQNYVNDPINIPDSEGLIYVPIKLSSDSESGIELSIEILHIYQYVWATFQEPNPHQNPCLLCVSADIYYTGPGGLEIIFITDSELLITPMIPDENWEKPAIIKSHYADVNNDGLIDGTTISEFTLQMYWWDENTQSWVPAGDIFGEDNTGVNTVNNYIWTNVDHFCNFTVKGSYVPIAETEALIETLDIMNIPNGIKNSLRVKLEDALAYLNAAQDNFIRGDLEWGNENLTLAKNKLIDFINEVEALRGLLFSEECADILIMAANEIIALIDEAYV